MFKFSTSKMALALNSLEEEKSPQQGAEHHYKDPVPTADVIVRKGNLILLEQRGRGPFVGSWCFPGGHMDYGETIENTALRELKEETSVEAKLVGILGVFSDPHRDPRGQRITVVFIADWVDGSPLGGDDAKTAMWINETELRDPKFQLAFDHALILRDYFMWKEYPTETFWSSKDGKDR